MQAQHDKVRLMLTHIAPNSGASCLDTLTSTAMYTLSHNGVLGLLSPVTLIDVLEVLSSQSNAADEAMARAFREAGKDFDPGWLDANCDGAQQGAYRAFKEVNGEGVGHAAIRDNAAHIIINGRVRRSGSMPSILLTGWSTAHRTRACACICHRRLPCPLRIPLVRRGTSRRGFASYPLSRLCEP